MTSNILFTVLAISGGVIACRVWGALPFVNSPMNAEGLFAIAGLSLLIANSGSSAVPALSRVFPAAALRQPGTVAIISLFLLTAAAFYRTASLYFLSDDFLLLTHARTVGQDIGARFTTGGGDGFYRPVGYIVLGVTSAWAGTDPLPWHLAGLALHTANAILVFLLAFEVGLSRLGAWAAAAVFVVHGTRPESVVWLAGRFDLVAMMFVLAGLLAFLRDWHVAALLMMTLGMLSKESAYAFPLLLLLFGRRRIQILAPYFAIAAALFAYRWSLFNGIGGYGGAISTVTVCKALALRLWAVLFFPIDWAWRVDSILALITALYVAALIGMFTARIPRNRVLIPLGFTVLAALPAVQQLLIGPDMQKSRLLYLPSVGFCLLTGAAIDYLKPRARVAVTAAVIAFQCTALWHNAGAWESASRQAQEVCAAAARTSDPTEVPGSLNGVYFFANGFPECVEFERAKLR